ncbi:MAG TPA: SusC/RagA family TonB-linked outer membrane protein, partial [Chitinophagaceae bacterium]
VGATVQPKGSKKGTSTGADGSFSLTVAPDVTTLVVTSVGFDRQEISVSGQTAITVSMVASNASLNEVVVVGYGTARRKDLTGSIASVKAKDFNQGAISTPDQLLQNKVPGLEITTNSGQPGAATTIKIRGNNSIRASNNPLYVIDGVPLDGRTARPSLNLGTNGLGFGTTPESNPLLYINPNDIAQIDVLKDASSAAIYGSRGANGVIVITTKKGSSGPTRMDMNTSWGVSGYMKKYPVLSTSQFRSALAANSITKYDSGSSVDPMKEIAQHTISQNYNMALSGGSETGKFRASLLASSQPGLLKKSSLDKYVGTFTGAYKFLDKRLSIDFSLIAGHVTENLVNVSNTAGSQGNLVSAALNWNPTVPFRTKDGLYNLNANATVNPLALSDAFNDVARVNTFLGNISASYKITDNLEYKFLYAINHGTGQRLTNIEGFLVGFPGLSGQGYAVISDAAITSQTFTHTLNYRTSLSKDLTFEALAGYEYWKSDYSNSNVAATGFNTDLDQTTRIQIPYTSIFQDAKTQFPLVAFVDPTTELQSYFGRVNFNYRDKLYLTGTLRADGSSKFGANKKYGYFPSVGAKYSLSNEDFMKNSTVFSNLALRVSYGITGNQEFPAGSSQEQFSFSSYNTTAQTIVSNPNLKWETTKSINIGVDFALAKGKVYGTIDYYHKDTRDILFQASAIQPAPNSIYFINLPADLINSGVEFGIGVNAVSNKDFTWDFNFNIAYNKNLLKNFYDVNTGLPIVIQTGQINGQGVSGTLGQVITNGQPVNEFFLKQFSGFDQNHAQIIAANPTYAGDPNPHVLAGFGTTLRYKAWNVVINTGGAFGYMIYNNTATSVTNINSLSSGRNIDKNALNSGEAISDGAAASTRFLESGNYVKLRNATLRYDVGNVGKSLKNLSVYVSGTNLFVITKFSGFDPEVNIDKNNNNYPSRSIEYIPYPTARTITFGLNFSL